MTDRRALFTLKQDRYTTTPQNGLAVEAVVSRVGVLEYEDFNGSTHKEFRPAEEVFSSASIESLKHATVTVEHPPENRIHSENYRAHVVGHVGEDVRPVGDTLVATLYINDEKTIQAIMAGELKDLSPGYKIQHDPTPGTDDKYGQYDTVQRNIQYNHISLLPFGDGRQGEQVGLRLDSKGSVVINYSQLRSDSSMDPEQLKSMIAEQMPDQEALLEKLSAQIAETLPAMIKEMLATEMASAGGGDEAAAVDGGAEKLDDAESDAGDDPIGGLEDELKLDEMVEERLDKRLEVIRLCEKVSGGSIEHKGIKEVDMLRSAAKAAGLEVRADASRDRLIGSLETLQTQAPVTIAGRVDSRDRAEKSEAQEFVTHADRVAAYNQKLSSAYKS